MELLNSYFCLPHLILSVGIQAVNCIEVKSESKIKILLSLGCSDPRLHQAVGDLGVSASLRIARLNIDLIQGDWFFNSLKFSLS
jgi:hypothetical protein